MTLVVTRDAPGRIRGFLASCMLELAPGVYCGPRLSPGVRDRIWDVVAGWQGELGEGFILMTWPDPKAPGGQQLRLAGTPPVSLVEHEGVLLAKRENPEE